MCGFSDASMTAYKGVVYLRTSYFYLSHWRKLKLGLYSLSSTKKIAVIGERESITSNEF